ncbi:unnamed protein product [Closterium sp. NIES-64]|nr:unnamed protein product [Closterium sp. NIES-64]
MQQQPRPQQGWGGPVGGRQLVWYGHEEYHPVQAGSIDGTDTRPHDRAIKRALLARRLAACFNRADNKPCAAAMDAACTLFVGRMLPTTTEDCLLQAVEAHGSVKQLRIVRNIGAGGLLPPSAAAGMAATQIW